MYNVIEESRDRIFYKFYNFKKDGYIEYHNKNNDIIEQNGELISTTGYCKEYEYYYWGDVDITRKDIQDEHNVELFMKFYINDGFLPRYANHNPGELKFICKRTEADEIETLYSQRNQEIHLKKKSINSYIDNTILEIAENLLNIIDEGIMLDYHVVTKCHLLHSHIIMKHNDNQYSEMLSYETHGPKGKEKKDAERKNANLHRKFTNINNVIEKFAEIIEEEKQVTFVLARAVAWEAIQKKTIEYYSEKWKNEYEIYMEKSYEELFYNQNNQNIDEIEKEYIKEVILCDEININDSQEMLMYFFLSKKEKPDLILYDLFKKIYKNIREISQEIETSVIKKKLKTKQRRKVSNYSINDVDLMNGTEFEEFISLLFRKMGYSTEVTKQSGDQGIDIIVERNRMRIGIQAKCYSNTAGNSAVQEVVAGKSFYNCDKVVVITNNYFTPAAMELAQSNDVILWGRDILKEKIKELM